MADDHTTDGSNKAPYQFMPELSATEYSALRDSIAADGCLEPVVYDEQGNILDGHHRVQICHELGIPDADIPRQVVAGLTDDQKERRAYILNTTRRHLTGEQRRGLIRDRLMADPNQSDRQVAALLGVSHHTVAAVRTELEGRGQIAHSDTTTDTLGRTQPRERRPVTVYNPSPIESEALRDPDIVHRMQDTGGTVASARREQYRDKLNEELGSVEHHDILQAAGTYDVIVIDPPWPMKRIELDADVTAVEMPYPTMSLDEIRALQVPAADDCHLFLWTTQRFLADARSILESWDFRYICLFTWDKGHNGIQPIGLPKFNSEFILYGRKGSPQFLDTKAFYTCFSADPTGHSEKPEAFYDVLRRVTGGRRLDMFNRRDIEGFDGWGREAPDPDNPPPARMIE